MEKRLIKTVIAFLTIFGVLAAVWLTACAMVWAINHSPYHLDWVLWVMRSNLPGWAKEFLWGWW